MHVYIHHNGIAVKSYSCQHSFNNPLHKQQIATPTCLLASRRLRVISQRELRLAKPKKSGMECCVRVLKQALVGVGGGEGRHKERLRGRLNKSQTVLIYEQHYWSEEYTDCLGLTATGLKFVHMRRI